MKLAAIRRLYLVLLIFFISGTLFAGTLQMDSGDEVIITADTYIVNHDPKAPIIALYHQAGWSRGEYLEIAPKLNQLGFNCIAIDLRSGEGVNGVENLTAKHAKEKNKKTRYVDALPDILSSLHYIKNQYPESKIIAWGSSYSAALVLHVAGTHPDLVDGVLSFAPGEYFSKQGKSNTWIQSSSTNITIPVFITSARNEEKNWIAIFNSIKSNKKTSFLPDSKGNHGSRALWSSFSDNQVYWQAVTTFLEDNF
jgi:pimeloyl-ACP methyl ester carboxylesterase